MAAEYIRGIGDTRKALLKLRDELEADIDAAGIAALQPMLEAARANVSSQHVRDSLDIVQDPEPGVKRWLLGPARGVGGWSFAKVAVVATALEFGRVGSNSTPARPWLRPAFESTKQQVVEEFGRVISAAIARVSTK